MKAEAIVIQRPHRQRPGQRLLFALITLAAWMVWSWLWLPLVTFVAWGLGVRTSFIELAMRKHGQGAHDLLVVALIGAACAAMAAAWSKYNEVRYGQLTRRRARPLVDRRAMARALKVQPQTAVKMREAQRIVLDFPENGEVMESLPKSG